MITLTQLIFILVYVIIANTYVLFFYHSEEKNYVDIEEECLEQENAPELRPPFSVTPKYNSYGRYCRRMEIRAQGIDMPYEQLNALVHIEQTYLAKDSNK